MKLCPKCSSCYENSDFVCPVDGQVLEHAWPESRLIANKYQLESVLARGGMGVIYRARQFELNREVAIKILSPQLLSKERMVRQFHREALAVARLDHANIVPIYDYGTLDTGGGAYLVMRLVHGRQLSGEIYDQGALPILRTLLIMQQVCDGVSAAHGQEIVHCDLKPDNILLERVGNRELALLVDFGISRLREMSVDGSMHSAITESAIGTPQYMSPEQCCGEPITLHTDIYSLGIIVFEMLTGRVPFRSSSAAEVAKHHVRTTPPPPSRFNSDIPYKIDQVILRALGKRPADRPDSVREFFQNLLEASGINLSMLTQASNPPTGTNPTMTSQQAAAIQSSSQSSSLQETGKLPPSEQSQAALSQFLEENKLLTQTSKPQNTLTGLNNTLTGPNNTNPYFEPVDKKLNSPPIVEETFENLSVLIVASEVDGEPELFQSILQAYGCKVLIANNEETAWYYLCNYMLDLVICDIYRSQTDGWQLYAKAEQLPFTPLFIFTTDEDNDDDRLRALEQGVEDYWAKPFAMAEIQIRLKRLLKRLSTEQKKDRQPDQPTSSSILDEFESHFTVGVSYSEYGLWEDAIEELRIALETLANTPAGTLHFRCCYELGRCYKELGQVQEARQWLQYSISIPGFTPADYDKVQQTLGEIP